MTALTYRYAAMTDVGRKRSNNQDSGYASGRLLVIADGMGGAAAGDLASATTMEALVEIDRDLDPDSDGDALDALTEALSVANHRLGELIRDNPAVEGMGTTLDAMLWDGEKLAVAHIGDSRAYRLRNGQLAQISTDHTYVQGLVEEGRLTPSEARVHPHRSLLLRAILGRDDLDPDFTWLQPMAGDRYLLCSDGLSDMVDDEVIEQVLRGENVDIIAQELVTKALEAGGLDNITVVVAEFTAATNDLDDSLSCADGRPQVVGAAAENPQPRTGLVSNSTVPRAPTLESVEEDPEVLRYAPRPTPRFGWLRWLLVLGVLIVGAVVGGIFAKDWIDRQYFVAEHDGYVTIFRGIDATLPGINLASVDEVTDIAVEDLPSFHRRRLGQGITATDREEAVEIVKNLETSVIVPEPSEPTPEPSDEPTEDAADDAEADSAP